MPLMIDPNQDDGSAFKEITPGRKLCHVVGFRQWVASTGTPMMTVGFIVLADATKSGDEGEIIMDRFALIERAAFRISEFSRAIGFGAPWNAEILDDWQKVGSHGPIVLEVKAKTYNGKTRPEVDKYAPFKGESDPGWEAMIAQGEAEFERIQNKIEERIGSAPSAPAPAPVQPSSGFGGDIPF